MEAGSLTGVGAAAATEGAHGTAFSCSFGSSSRSESLISSISFINELVLIKGRDVGLGCCCLSCNKPNLGSWGLPLITDSEGAAVELFE